jgi:hypothetical protein
MARLFVTSREIQFINDISKEFIKDIVGQTINYYPVSTLKTKVHPVYDEAVKKIFDNPIRVPVLADQPQAEHMTNVFGSEKSSTLEVFIQARDLIDKGFTLYEGDFFTYGDQAYEIASFTTLGNIYGQEEYEVGYKVIGHAARLGQFDVKNSLQPNKDSAGTYEETQVQKTFEQQRGFGETPLDGTTGDVRQLRERLKDDMAEIALGEGPRVVGVDADKGASSFYNDEDDQ